MKHWLHNYVGKPWSQVYDCFAHFAEVQKKEFAVQGLADTLGHLRLMPYGDALQFAQTSPQIKSEWEPVDEPRNGDAVVFAIGRVKFHIGTWLDVDGGGVLHCVPDMGVVFTRKKDLSVRNMKFNLVLRRRAA